MNFSFRKKNFYILIFTLISFFPQKKLSAQEPKHVPGDLIVMLKNEADARIFIQSFLRYHGAPTQLTAKQLLSRRLNIWLLHFNSDAVNENDFLNEIRNSDLVKIAQFNHEVTKLRNIPNDALFDQQWNMLNSVTPGADIHATEAWDITTGGLTADGDTIVLAIDDDGFDLNHGDLDFWKNYAEIPGNGIDDDSNGYVDDYNGWNSIDSNGVIGVASGHGTEVTGLAGARGNNGTGMAGVNWTVKIMPVIGDGDEAQVVAGYAYILEMRARYNQTKGKQGAFVVATNSSFGIDGRDGGQPDNYPLWCAFYDSLGHYGILNVAATTNLNTNVDAVGDMPTSCPSDYLVTVTNTTKTDQLYSSAGYGDSTIDLGAPGTFVLTTYLGNSYTSGSLGTSLSSPQVAGAVALIYSVACEQLPREAKSDPAATALLLKNFILNGVDSLASLTGKTVSGGRLNLFKSLELAIAYYNCNVGIDDVKMDANDVIVFPNPATDEITIWLKNNAERVTDVSLINVLGQRVMSRKISSSENKIPFNISGLNNGIYFVQIKNGNEIMDLKKILIR